MRARVAIGAVAALAWATAARAERVMPGRFRLTQYWVAREASSGQREPVVRVFDPRGATVAWACRRFVAALTMEGTGRTWDGRLLNWASRVAGRACFVEVDPALYPWGVGVQGYALVPFRSLAVDARFVPVGHVVEMPEVRGVPLPDGTRHDGCFVAVDGGGAIRGHHIDLFVPTRADYERLSAARALPERVTVVVDAPRCAHARRWVAVPSPDGLPADGSVLPRW